MKRLTLFVACLVFAGASFGRDYSGAYNHPRIPEPVSIEITPPILAQVSGNIRIPSIYKLVFGDVTKTDVTIQKTADWQITVGGSLICTKVPCGGAGGRIVGQTDPDLQTAINNAGNGGIVTVPPGTALSLTSTVTIAHALHLIIQSNINSTADPIFAITGTGGILIEGGGDGPTGKLVSDSVPTITQDTSGAKMMTVGDGVVALRGGIVENLRFVATTNSATSTFQLNANIGDFKFRHLFVSGAGFDGTAGNYTRVSFDHVRVDSAQNQAWNFQCAIGCVADWNNTYANATGGSPAIGYDIGGAGGGTVSFTSCYADSNSQAFRVKGNVRITNCETEGNTGDGINIVGGGLITISGYRSFQDQLPVVMNATGATVIVDGIRTQGTTGANSITHLAAEVPGEWRDGRQQRHLDAVDRGISELGKHENEKSTSSLRALRAYRDSFVRARL